MSEPFRLARGGLVDRSRPLRFRWEGRALTGYAGDTLASALVANGVRVVGRSFKTHRPRGIFGAGVEDGVALVALGEGERLTPNVRATEAWLHEGLVARPVNCWPSARLDLSAALGLASRFLPAGFYYKTFMWPHWSLFEGPIRRMAGLGRAAAAPDPDRYDQIFATCDVLVIGAGRAGLEAARASAASGARVILAEQDMRPGGRLLVDHAEVEGRPGVDWADEVARAFSSMPAARLLLGTVATGVFDHNVVTLVEADSAGGAEGRPVLRRWMVCAGRILLATGAIERPLLFPGNDAPGVMLASAARTYVSRFAALPGRRAVVLTTTDDAYNTAFALADAGAEVAAVIDLRLHPVSDLVEATRARGIPVHIGARVTATRGAPIRAVRIETRDGGSRWLTCDHLSVSGGFDPALHLFGQAGGRARWDDLCGAFVAEAGGGGVTPIGAAAGGRESAPPVTPSGRERRRTYVDLTGDITAADVELAAREGFRSVEHLKRYTTLGMGPDQGRGASLNGVALLAAETRRSIAETGQTRFRPPFTPVPLGAFAGRRRGALARPLRRLPSHDRLVRAAAALEDYGGWLRPAAFPHPGETIEAAARREAGLVRGNAGLFEASPLGKIEVVGADAAAFLDFVYANTMSTLPVGNVRYGLMLDEQGIVIDDGVAARRGASHFLVCTSSGGAERIAAWLDEWRQGEWAGADLIVAPVTQAWATLTLTGPAARTILTEVGTDIDLADFLHLRFRAGRVAGLPARVLRVSYTGEASYELNVPAREAGRLWDALIAAGAAPFGIEALMILRAEKGFIHVGSDTDGTTNAFDIGWQRALDRKSCDFIGRRSLMRPNDRDPDRRQLVGLASDKRLPTGSQIVGRDGRSEGVVTTSISSPTLGRPIALGLLRAGRARLGETVSALGPDGRLYGARVAPIAAYDPEGLRLDG